MLTRAWARKERILHRDARLDEKTIHAVSVVV
jgi:hypothetical protein